MSYDPGRCFWCENMQCDNCNGINEWRNPHASATIGGPCKCYGNHPYKLRPRKQTGTAWDLLGIDPDFTGGLSVDEYMDKQRGRATNAHD